MCVYLALWGPSCSTQDLCFLMWIFCWGPWTSSCVFRSPSSVPRGILVSRPGIKPVSPALQGEFLTAGPPSKSQGCLLREVLNSHHGNEGGKGHTETLPSGTKCQALNGDVTLPGPYPLPCGRRTHCSVRQFLGFFLSVFFILLKLYYYILI